MQRRLFPFACPTAAAVVAAATLLCAAPAAYAQITLVGTGSVPGLSSDLSGLSGTYTNPANPSQTSAANQLGAFGSGLAYTGFGNRYIAVNDRGPFDGAVNYLDRFHVFDIAVNAATGTVTPTLVDTRFLSDTAGQTYIGASAAFANNRRFDPEGVRVGRDGTFFVSDEYGPYLYQFDQQGRQIRQINVPEKFGIANPSGNGAQELPPANATGRQSNRGMEGLAISPDGTALFGIMQSPLIQDGGLNASNQRRGTNNRILKVDLLTGATSEYLFQLSDRSNGVSEILAINANEFLVLERDGNPGASAVTKQIFKINLSGATDISNIGTTALNGLPQTGTPTGVVPVGKSLFLDLLDPAYGLAGPTLPEKFEGMAWGADFDNGDHLLMLVNDNDLTADPSNFYAFRVGAGAVPGFQAQTINTPFAAANVIPEPGALALLASVLPLVGMLGLRQQRRRARRP